MKRKHLILAIVVLLVAGGLWFAREFWRGKTLQNSNTEAGLDTQPGQKSNADAGFNRGEGGPKPGQMLRPPDPSRKYRDLTPEQRVKQSRQPQGG